VKSAPRDVHELSLGVVRGLSSFGVMKAELAQRYTR
jgi:hypothetical protein